MSSLNRRKLLALGLSSLGLPLFYSLKKSPSFFKNFFEEGPNQFFVVFKLDGGWDTVLSFDPWIPTRRPEEQDLFLDYHSSEIAKSNEIFLGPCAQSLLKFSNDMIIINGVVMGYGDLGHSTAITYMDSGHTKGQLPSYIVQLADNTKLGPYGIVTHQSMLMSKQGIHSSQLSDIKNTLYDSFIYPYISDLIKNTQNTPLVEAQKALVNTKDISSHTIGILKEYKNKFKELDYYHALSACFLTGASYHADITINQDLDTHSAHKDRHKKFLKTALDEAATLIQFFKTTPYGNEGKSLYDHTTFVITSEFSRNPWLNGALGKDHNFMNNSVIVISKKIYGGKTIGKTKLITRDQSPFGFSYQMGSPFDFSSGRAIEHDAPNSAEFIFPENVFKTIGLLTKERGKKFFDESYDKFKIIPNLIKV